MTVHPTRAKLLEKLYRRITRDLQLFALLCGSEGFLSDYYFAEKTTLAEAGELENILDPENRARFRRLHAQIKCEYTKKKEEMINHADY
jgi:hypothetical protein